MHFETKAVHSGAHAPGPEGDVADPIHISTTFRRTAEGEPVGAYGYVREGNPTQHGLEQALAAIESAGEALFFASGMAAAAALLQSLPSGSRVLLPDDGYYGVRRLAAEFFPRWGLTFDVLDMSDLDAVRAAAPGAALVWAESPSNPLLKVVDLRAIGAIAHEAGAVFLVDGTFATPALQRPVELGADVVLHSTTKYLGGHSDVMGGSLAFRESGPLCESARRVRYVAGAVASPFSAWLVHRGIRTLAARMRVHSENALAVARFLERHPRVTRVFYPGLESHPGHAIARAQMSQFGGMLSFLVRGTREDALGVAAATKIFTPATSLGGVESLVEHRQSSEGAGSVTDPALLRLSIGLEHADDLVADLAQALG